VIEVHGTRAVLTDIEGTTSSLSFVKDVLFPYARKALPQYVQEHQSRLQSLIADIAATVGKPGLSMKETVDILLQWMDEDRKVTPLKTLQGMVWKTGYENGELQSHVYDDAVRALRQWHARGVALYVYSSGSIEAQKLLFSHTPHGDLAPLFSGYFDTTTGPKLESRSYETIVRSLQLPARAVVFLSDHEGELQAAAAAGLRIVLVARERGAESSAYVRNFDELSLAP